MIEAKISPTPSILLVFDVPQHKNWIDTGYISADGMGAFLTKFMEAGIAPIEHLSAVCLSDVKHPKAADFKAKAEYIESLFETYQFNVVVPVGAEAFSKIMGYKGIEKFFEKVVKSPLYNCKVVPCPNPQMVRYKPEIAGVIRNTMTLIKEEMEFSEVKEVQKMPVHYTILDNLAKVKKWCEIFMTVPRLAVDLETTGFRHNADEILTVQFSHKPGFSYLIPSNFYQENGRMKYWTPSEWSEVVNCVRRVMCRRGIKIIGHNLKFDLKFMYHHWKVPLPRPEDTADTMFMSFLVNENTPNDLKYQACVNTDLGDYEKELDFWKKAYCKEHKIAVGAFSYKYVPFPILSEYALTDTDATIRLYELYLPLIEQEDQEQMLQRLMKYSYTAARMELNGWPVNLEYARKYLKELEEKIEALGKEIKDIPEVHTARRILEGLEVIKENKKRKNKITELKYEFEFKITSNDHKKILFLEVMKLPVLKYTKARDENGKRTTPSIDKEVMEEWCYSNAKAAPIIEKIKSYNELCKMKSTYVEAIINKSVNGRIHPTYNIIGAKTGRLSSREPNFQNLPVRNSEAKNVKKIIKARDGYVLIGADLSAAEMRYLCICSGDTNLQRIFNEGLDIHGAVAKDVFHLPCHPNEVKKLYPELRDIAKTIQFLVAYGGGADTLASKVKLKPDRAAKILESVASVDQLAEQFKFPLDKARKVFEAKDKVGALMKAFTITSGEAQEILNEYFKKYPGITQYIDDTIDFTKERGYSLSLLGRKRRVPEVNSEDDGVKERGVRQAVNATIQSVASDGMMESLTRLQAEVFDTYGTEDPPMLMLGPIHDAGYFEVKKEFMHEAHDLIIKYLSVFPEALAGAVTIPMVADAEWGVNWAEFQEDFGETLAVAADEYEEEDEEQEAA